MKIALILASMFVLAGCPKSSPPPPIIQAAENVGCAVETSLSNSFGTSLANSCQGNAAACGPALLVALGNVDLCGQPVPAAPAGSQMATLLAANPKWQKIGDIPASALQGQAGKELKAQVVHQLGIIGSVVCPLAVGSVLGFVSAAIPPACGCTQSLSASAVDAAFVAGCQALTATLP